MPRGTEAGFMVIHEKDWENSSPEQRDWLVFNTLQSMNTRLEILEQCRTWDKLVLFAGGVIGGFAAACGLTWLT